PVQSFSLRSHGAAVSAMDSNTSSGATFISADSDGWVIWWNISIKRPILKWKAHQSKIISVKLLGHERVITQSRDSSVKIWQLGHSSDPTMDPIIEVPINSLNFCNVEFHEPILFTPATIDSNNFDMYKLQVSKDGYEISRVIANYNVHELYSRQSPVIDIPSDPELARSGFGIIMRMVFIEEESNLFLGFESGHVIGVHIDFQESVENVKSNERTVINKDPKLKLIYSDSSHSPNPIITLVHLNNRIISGSTNKKLVIHDYISSRQQVKKLSNAGIESICPHGDGIIVGFWNGVIEGVRLDSDDHIFEFKRSLPQINLTESNSTSVNETSQEKRNAIRLSCIQSISIPSTKSTNLSYKDMVRARRSGLGRPLILAGYEDGTIVAF
ncbi:uncharacterized protein CANTADRAFT_37400, partial [Suhomyces tanzawaensis NRRL Y-17324]